MPLIFYFCTGLTTLAHVPVCSFSQYQTRKYYWSSVIFYYFFCIPYLGYSHTTWIRTCTWFCPRSFTQFLISSPYRDSRKFGTFDPKSTTSIINCPFCIQIFQFQAASHTSTIEIHQESEIRS